MQGHETVIQMLKGNLILLGMKNKTLAENWTLKGRSVNTEKSAVLSDTPTYFVRIVTVFAIKKNDVLVKANTVQYTASQTWRVK